MTRGKYDAWTHEELGRALAQAEDDIEGLKLEMEEVMRDRDRYYHEARESAGVLGGILRVMGDNDMIREDLLPDDAPSLREAAARPRRFTRERVVPLVKVHRYIGTNAVYDLCACGAQWLVQAERCVTQPVGL